MQNGYSVTPGNSLPSYDEVLLQIWARSSRLPRYSSRALRRAQHHPYAHDRRRPDSDCVRNPADPPTYVESILHGNTAFAPIALDSSHTINTVAPAEDEQQEISTAILLEYASFVQQNLTNGATVKVILPGEVRPSSQHTNVLVNNARGNIGQLESVQDAPVVEVVVQKEGAKEKSVAEEEDVEV